MVLRMSHVRGWGVMVLRMSHVRGWGVMVLRMSHVRGWVLWCSCKGVGGGVIVLM